MYNSKAKLQIFVPLALNCVQLINLPPYNSKIPGFSRQLIGDPIFFQLIVYMQVNLCVQSASGAWHYNSKIPGFSLLSAD
jgi:hypothetical protein